MMFISSLHVIWWLVPDLEISEDCDWATHGYSRSSFSFSSSTRCSDPIEILSHIHSRLASSPQCCRGPALPDRRSALLDRPVNSAEVLQLQPRAPSTTIMGRLRASNMLQETSRVQWLLSPSWPRLAQDISQRQV